MFATHAHLAVILSALALVYAAGSTCDPAVISAIQQSRQNSNDSKILDKISGEYLAVYLYAGWETSFMRFICIETYYTHNAWGVNIDYHGLSVGSYNATFFDGAIQYQNENGDVLWSSYIVQSSNNVITTYTCTNQTLISLTDFAMSTVNVKAGALDSSSKQIQEGKEALEKLGIHYLYRLPLCPTIV